MKSLLTLFLALSFTLHSEIDPWEGHLPPEEDWESFEAPQEISPFFDLDQFQQDFILESKEIQIPGFKLAFNPAIVRWRDSILMSFRIRDERGISMFTIGLVWLDENFQPISTPQILEIPATPESSVIKFQDPRLVVVDDHLHLVFSNILDPEPGKRERRKMFFSRLHFDGDSFKVSPPFCLTNFEAENPQRWEKNWAPFDYQGNLLLTYDLQPHRIFFPNVVRNRCDTVASTPTNVNWNWGILRGGTPPQLEGDEYLAFFHSCKNMPTKQSKGENVTHYFFGAYTFSAIPPFNITKISPHPIVGNRFYNGKSYNTWKPLRVVFPCGHITDENYVWVAHGRQDHECWITKLDKKKLLQSLVPVKP